MYVCVCVNEGAAREDVFHLLSHGCQRDGRAGAAVAHGKQIFFSVHPQDLSQSKRWGVVEVGVPMGWQCKSPKVAACKLLKI